MIERGDHEVVDEPFSARYYFSDDRRSDRFGAEEPHAGREHVVAELRSLARHRPVFVKDMAYHVTGADMAELLADFTNTFLVREPVAAIASLARMWPDFTDEEAGYTALADVFRCASAIEPAGAPPPVIEADDLAAHPSEVVAAWCRAVDIPFLPEALTWAPGMVDQWTRWREWYTGAAESTGFVGPRTRSSDQAVDPRVAEVAARSRATYDELVTHRLSA